MALALGGMTVGELLERISSRELTEWMAYYHVEPFGAERDNMHAGIVAATIANANRNPKKQRKAFSFADFILKFTVKKKTPEQMLQVVEMLNAAFGGKDLRGGRGDVEPQRREEREEEKGRY